MTTREEWAKALDKRIENRAADYRDEDFLSNPDGYTVAPYVNRETTSTAFEGGANYLKPLVLDLIEALEESKSQLEWYEKVFSGWETNEHEFEHFWRIELPTQLQDALDKAKKELVIK